MPEVSPQGQVKGQAETCSGYVMRSVSAVSAAHVIFAIFIPYSYISKIYCTYMCIYEEHLFPKRNKCHSKKWATSAYDKFMDYVLEKSFPHMYKSVNTCTYL